jgi:hypothetical protein
MSLEEKSKINIWMLEVIDVTASVDNYYWFLYYYP